MLKISLRKFPKNLNNNRHSSSNKNHIIIKNPMEALSPSSLLAKNHNLSTYIHEFIAKAKDLCSLVQKTQKNHIKTEKKLGIYEKFQGLNRLSQSDLERLEKHFFKGLNEIKEEIIKRRYQSKIDELHARLGEKPDGIEKNRGSARKKEEIDEKCEDLIEHINAYDRLEADSPTAHDALFFIKEENSPLKSSGEDKASPTPKKTRQFSLGCPLEETVKDLNSTNENVLTKVSSFGEEANRIEGGLSQEKKEDFTHIQEFLNSTNMENGPPERKISNCEDFTLEHSPDFSFKSHMYQKTRKQQEGNLSFDLASVKKKEKRIGRNPSLSEVMIGESLNFSFHFDDEEKNRKQQRNEGENELMRCSVKAIPKENMYLMKLSKELKHN